MDSKEVEGEDEEFNNNITKSRENLPKTALEQNTYHTKDNSDSDLEMSSKIKKRKYNQKYKPEWEVSYPWLKLVENNAFCKLCFKILVNNKSHLERHQGVKQHILKMKEAEKIQTIDSLICKKSTNKNSEKLRSELICVMYCVQKNLPLSTLNSLPQLLKTVLHNASESEVKNVKCSRKKGTMLITQILAPFSMSQMCETLQKSRFCLILDETTDIATKKCLVIVARYFDNNCNKIKERFIDLLELNNSTAKEIGDAVKDFLKINNIPTKMMIGLATDNASVMRGSVGGVKTILKNEVNNDMFYLGCTSHSLHLCSSNASKKIPLYVEEGIKSIYYHFAHSAKRQTDLKDFQKEFNSKEHKIMKYCATRWLSLENVINRVLEQWQPLFHYFHLYNFENKGARIAQRK